MAIRLVVFDMAGTTVDDRDAVNRGLRDALGRAGLAVAPEAVNAVMGLPKPEALRLLIGPSPDRDRLLGRLDAILADFSAAMIRFYRDDPTVAEIPGASALFLALRRAGVRVALDTGFSRAIAAVLIDRLGWARAGLLDATVTSDEVARGRPYPDMIHRLMAELGIADPRDVAKVGDTPSDLDQGTAAGCGRVIGVSWGTHTRQQLATHPHTHLIDAIAELPGVLGLNRSQTVSS